MIRSAPCPSLVYSLFTYFPFYVLLHLILDRIVWIDHNLSVFETKHQCFTCLPVCTSGGPTVTVSMNSLASQFVLMPVDNNAAECVWTYTGTGSSQRAWLDVCESILPSVALEAMTRSRPIGRPQLAEQHERRH